MIYFPAFRAAFFDATLAATRELGRLIAKAFALLSWPLVEYVSPGRMRPEPPPCSEASGAGGWILVSDGVLTPGSEAKFAAHVRAHWPQALRQYRGAA